MLMHLLWMYKAASWLEQKTSITQEIKDDMEAENYYRNSQGKNYRFYQLGQSMIGISN